MYKLKSAVYYREVRKYPLNAIYILNSLSCQKNVCKQAKGSYTIKKLDSTSVKQT